MSDAELKKRFKDATYGNEGFSHISGSFTPINRSPVVVSTPNHAPRNHSRGLNSDDLYDPPDESLLLGPPAPKKRRTSPPKTRRRKNSSSSITHPMRDGTKGELLQPRIPLDSERRFSTRPSTRTELSSSFAICDQIRCPVALTTTEHATNVKSVPLGQTTMERLASFRYKPNLQCYPVSNTRGNINHTGGIVGPFLADASANHSLKEPINVCHRANVVGYGDASVTADEGGLLPRQQGFHSSMELDSEDDFPVDSDLEAEMAQLSMPDRLIYGNLSKQLYPQPLHNEKLQSRNTGYGHCQTPSRSSRTLVGAGKAVINIQDGSQSLLGSVLCPDTLPLPLNQAVDLLPTRWGGREQLKSGMACPSGTLNSCKIPAQASSIIESFEYSPLKPFARPAFPVRVSDRSPITGISANTLLRTCFRIGEALREGSLCERLGQDAVLELFARVTSSSKGDTPSKLYFQLADIFHDRPPLIYGELENYKISPLQEAESRMLLGLGSSTPMVRCLGKLKRTIADLPNWKLHIINIRPTDWKEVRRIRLVVGAEMIR